MLQLPNGCSCTELSVTPSNWRTGGKSLTKKPWRIIYYFKDPKQPQEWHKKYPYGKQIPVKGMNDISIIEERREVTQAILDNEWRLLKSGYNPLLKKIIVPDQVDDITESTPFLEALQAAKEKMKVSHGVQLDLKSVLKYTAAAAKDILIVQNNRANLYLAVLPISEVKRKHILKLLDYLPKVKTHWSANTHNYYRAHLSMLFKQLLKMQAVEFNPVQDIDKEDVVTEVREGIDQEQRHLIDMHLKKKGLTSFRLFNRLFFHSGIRISELLLVRAKDVNLQKQIFRCLVKKGRRQNVYYKTIKNIALPYWRLALKKCPDEHFLFSKGLTPGALSIRPFQITHRWKRHVKDELGIDINYYDHKHSNSTEVAEFMGDEVAAGLNSHRSTAMIRKVYDINRMSREHEEIKRAANHY